MNRKDTIRFETGISIALVVAVIAILLFPYATNGLWFDDALNSQTWGMLRRFDTNVWDFSMRVSKAWLFSAGRFLFGWPAIYGFFYAVKEPSLIRLADIAFVVIHLGFVIYLLRQVRISWSTVGVFLLFLVSLFQIRYSDDPIAAYATFCQVLGIAITFALILLVRWHETGSNGYLIASVVVIMCSLLCYELNVIYVPICIAAIVISKHPNRVRNLAIVLVPFALFVASALYLKHVVPRPYPGSTFGTLEAIPGGYIKQLVATLPGSFYFLRARPDYPVSVLITATLGSTVAWMLGALALAAYVLVAKRQGDVPSGVSRGIVATSAAFVLLPPILIAISARYQTHVGWGDAHLPIYYQYFGLAFLGAAASARILRGHRTAALIAMGSIFAVYVALNWMVNLRQVAYLDAVFAEPRDSLVFALKKGLFDSVRDGDVVEIRNQPIFINGNLIYQTIGKKVSIPDETATLSWFDSRPKPGPSTNHYILFRDPAAANAWRLSGEKTPAH